jgi:L-gulonate 5-dehydrogenase
MTETPDTSEAVRTSRAAVTSGAERIDLRQVEVDLPGPGEVLVGVEAAGICGTDLHLYDGSLEGGAHPMIQGHEFCGRIERIGDGAPPDLREGDRVVIDPVVSCGGCYPCRHGAPNACVRMEALGVHRPGGFQERVLVPATHVHRVDNLDPIVAALCEPSSIALHALTRAQVREGQQVLVLGAGTIGLCCTLAASSLGAHVVTVDLHPSRLRLAERFGAQAVHVAGDDVPQHVRAWTDGDGPAVVIEATGVGSVAQDAFHLVAASGTVALVGVSHQPVRVDLRLFTRKEVTVVGTRATRDFPAAVRFVHEHATLLEELVTHRVPLDEVERGLRTAATEPASAVKVMITVP